jgi:hypothetical protein
LIELIIVVAIVAILASGLMPLIELAGPALAKSRICERH